jgi:hypothetical protein
MDQLTERCPRLSRTQSGWTLEPRTGIACQRYSLKQGGKFQKESSESFDTFFGRALNCDQRINL